MSQEARWFHSAALCCRDPEDREALERHAAELQRKHAQRYKRARFVYRMLHVYEEWL